MMVHNSSGHLSLSGNMIRAVVLTCLVAVAPMAMAEPVKQDLVLESILESAINSWTKTILPEGEVMDEQIFTEISPLIDSPEGVQLPEDQQVAD